jgi:hypothetical protein
MECRKRLSEGRRKIKQERKQGKFWGEGSEEVKEERK